MKKLVVLVCLLAFGLTQAQKVKPTYERVDDLIKVTHFYDNGNVKEEGYFKGKKLAGTWIAYTKEGKKTRVAKYKNGKKVGKWMIFTKDGVKEVQYKNNTIASVKTFTNSNVAIK